MQRFRLTFMLVLTGVIVTGVLAAGVDRIVGDTAATNVAMAADVSTAGDNGNRTPARIAKLKSDAVEAAAASVGASFLLLFVFIVVADIGAYRAKIDKLPRRGLTSRRRPPPATTLERSAPPKGP